MYDDLLLQVKRPGRYLGKEWNVSGKDFENASFKFALCFPDLYEVGMSNLGLRIIYGILNSLEGVCCERFFAPESDLEDILRRQNLQLLSLESRRKLKQFDIIGFSLSYELTYTNVLNILELGGIPLKSELRNGDFPLVIAGGPCTFNPEPLHEFFDLFVIGEAEEAILEIVEAYRRRQGSKISKQELLFELAQIQGVYAPSFYEARHAPSGHVEEFSPKVEGIPSKINKRYIKDLDASFFPSSWLVPYIQIIHDRITLEITRGCSHSCRFCQARAQYFPYRQRSIENILNLARQTYQRTGYEEISIGGLSVSSYPGIEILLKELSNLFKEKAVALSLPSLKANRLVGDLSTLIAQGKKTALTFAPEAGSARLRQLLAKDFNEEEFLHALEQAYLAGYQHIKLYFMIGLPFEENKDLDSIVDFATCASQLKRRINRGPAQINISINTLIAKPHTCFQWFGMLPIDKIKLKQEYLLSRARKNRRLHLSFQNSQMSLLEAIFSRGDRRLSKLLLYAFQGGARLDAWGEHFDFRIWAQAFKDSGLDPIFYLQGKRQEELLPWDFIDVGITKQSLLSEYNKIVAV